jgi:uncharacterized protein involved in response to NO
MESSGRTAADRPGAILSKALWGYGFRPFFLGAGALAAVLIPWWAGVFAWGLPLGTSWPPALWHGHEMLFGFIAAAIAGFLLTAVPSWTGERGFAGWPLMSLATVWVLGRLAIATASLWPLPAVAALDLLFFPGLMILVSRPLLRARNRNTPLLAVLAALWAVDGAYYWGLLHSDPALSRHALFVGIDIVLLLITVVGGRIVPAFTSVALKHRGYAVRSSQVLTRLAIVVMLTVVIVDLWRPESRAAGIVAAAASTLHACRLAQWRGVRTLRAPIVWVLHVGYLWLAIGFALKAIALLTGLPFAAFYLHAFTIGAAATMIMAVMTRASLGHTGRPLVVARPTACAYGLLTVATAVRVFGPAWLPLPYFSVVLLAATLWTAAFVLFLAVYAPILFSPRVDGKPG